MNSDLLTVGEIFDQMAREGYRSVPYFTGDSPIEEAFWHEAHKWLDWRQDFEEQHEVLGGKYRIDFSVRNARGVVGFECDGKEFHNYEKDLARDREILGRTEFTNIVRMRGCDIWFNAFSTVRAVSNLLPHLFRCEMGEHLGQDFDFDGGYHDYSRDGFTKTIEYKLREYPLEEGEERDPVEPPIGPKKLVILHRRKGGFR